MAFKRFKDSALQSKAWRAFVTEHRSLANRIGIPETVFADRQRFEYFLMHGDCPGSHFALPPHGALAPEQRRLVRELVLAFLNHGLPDPGITLLSAVEMEALHREMS